jgi:steroid delta-isomerase-like uncharacterized protein
MDNKAIHREFFKAFEQGDFNRLNELITADWVDHDAPPGTPLGIAGMKQLLPPFLEAFPGLHFEIGQQIAEGDKVVTQWTFHGTQQAPLFGIPASGKTVEMGGMSMIRVENGKIKEAWVRRDDMGMMQQLGVIPAQ